MILEETYGNLNVLDKSFLYWVDPYENKDKTMELKNTEVSPESEVKIDPVKPHTMKHLIEILNEYNVAFIVFRINKKQICLISIMSLYGMFYTDSKYKVKANPIYNDLTRVSNFNVYKDDAQLKSWLNNIYKEYVNHFETTKKPVWDIIVVYKDKNVSKKWDERHNNKQGYIPTPKEKERYRVFLMDFQYALNEKRKKWVESHKKDAQNIDELKKILYQQCNIEKIKFKGNIYKMQDYGKSFLYTNKVQYIKYVYEDEKIPVQSLLIKYKVIGLNIKILGIYYSEKYSSNNLDDYKPLT